MARESEIETSIENLEEALNSGATTVSIDGTNVSLSPKDMRRRLKELHAELAELAGNDSNPVFRPINFNHSGNL